MKQSQDTDEPGEIYIVGVDPSARGRGLGRILTQAGLAHLRAAGRPGAILYVEAENQPALKLYRQLGFRRRFQHVCNGKALGRRRAARLTPPAAPALSPPPGARKRTEDPYMLPVRQATSDIPRSSAGSS